MERRSVPYPIAELVPHAGRMSLLDRALDGDDDGMRAEVTIREECIFFDGAGVPGWVGVELMAQTVAAWGGWHARREGRTPRIGFILGTRRYDATRSRFALGETLVVEIRRLYLAENGLGQFECSIRIGEDTVALAALNVFEPEDAHKFLSGEGP